MAGYRKLGRTSSQRKALLRNQVTNLLYHGKIVTTESKAKEIRSIAEHMITLAVKEKDNFETVTVKAKVARKDKDGKRVKEVVDGKKVTVYDEVEKEIKKDSASRLHARKQMAKFLYGVTEVPAEAAGKKKNTKKVANYCEIDENSNETGTLLTGPKVITKNKMLAYCWPGCLTIMYNADFVGEMQTIDIKINEEYALWIKISKKTDCHLLNENLAKYRRHTDSLSHQSYLRLIKWHYLMFRKLDNNVVASLILTAGNLIFGVYKKIVYRRKVSKG